jgi:SAM-dependent methyltransferase
MDNVEKYWEKIAKTNPYWGVLVNNKFLKKNLNSQSLIEFYKSGKEETIFIINYLKNKLNINIKDLKNDNFLEIGTGTGRIARHSIKYCNNLYCIDVSDKYLQLCSAVLPKNHTLINYKHFYDYNFEKVKLIYTWTTLQHYPPNEIKKIVKKFCEILIKDGIAILHIPYEKTSNYKYVDAEIMQMNCVPMDIIKNIIVSQNCEIIEIIDKPNHCGNEWKDCYYILKKL